MREINVTITESFETFDLELEADFNVYFDTYGEDADGNRGEPIVCVDLIKERFQTITDCDHVKFTVDDLDEIEEEKGIMTKNAEKEAVEKYCEYLQKL